jgi:hypothetical protein
MQKYSEVGVLAVILPDDGLNCRNMLQMTNEYIIMFKEWCPPSLKKNTDTDEHT